MVSPFYVHLHFAGPLGISPLEGSSHSKQKSLSRVGSGVAGEEPPLPTEGTARKTADVPDRGGQAMYSHTYSPVYYIGEHMLQCHTLK